jgi:TolB-like protein/Tfp pilus assembly protein PilF
LKSLKRELDFDQKSERSTQHEVSSVAILPFKNLAKDASVSFYEFSLADAVITELVRLRSLVVRPSSAISRYLDNPKDPLEAGRELKVNAVLAATFLHAPGRVRVTAQLLDVRNGELLWGDRIDSQANDIIAIQDIIAQRIVDGLNLQLSSDEQVDLAGHTTANVLAYEEYLRGRDRVGRYVYQTVANDDIESAIRHFQRAIEIDSRFALAHCALGSCYTQRILKGAGKPADLSRAKQALDKGLALDPRIIEARVFMVFVYLSRGDKQKGRIQIAELRDESPNNPTVHFVSAVLHRLDGEYEKALRSLDRLLQLNPAERLIVGYNRARISMYQGQYDDALSELDKVAAIGPHHPLLRCIRAQVLFYRAETASALEILEDVLVRHPEIDGIRPLLAQILSALGKHEAAQAQLTDRVKEAAGGDHDIPYWIASAYVMEGKLDEAFVWLEKAINAGNENLPWFKANPIWVPLHDDPRFKELMRRVEFGLIKVV